MNFAALSDNYPDNFVGYGNFGDVEALQDLQKALTAGAGVDAGAMTGGRALIPESLANTMSNVLWSQTEAQLFRRIHIQQINSPVHQWNKRTAVGSRDGAWVPEGGQSQEADQTIARIYETAKYLQTLRKVTIQATVSNMIENAMAIEQTAGALWITREVEHAMFYGDDRVFPEQPKGIKQQATSNVLDARGSTASSTTVENLIQEAARRIRDNYGQASLLLSSTLVHQEMQQLIRDRVRFGSGLDVGGTIFNKIPTPSGTLELQDDVFIKEGQTPVPSTLTSSRPAQVTLNSATRTATGNSEFTASNIGDRYYYQVAAVNRYGEGLASTAVRSDALVAAGDTVVLDVSVTPDASITAYAVYRSKKGASNGNDCRFMGYYANYSDGVNDTISDDNSKLPGTSDIFILTMDQIHDAIEWFQFLPLMKFDLYPTNEAVYPFLMLLFGALALKKEEQHAYIKNVAPASLGWF